jgi:hypothetical protein
MNVFIAKIFMYHQIQQLFGQGYSVAKISSVTGLHWRTVKKYLGMTEPEFGAFQENLSDRKKQLRPYERFVKVKLEAYRDTSAAQMHDWLKEHYRDFPTVNPKTVFNFVHWVRGKYNLPVIQPVREYETVPEGHVDRECLPIVSLSRVPKKAGFNTQPIVLAFRLSLPLSNPYIQQSTIISLLRTHRISHLLNQYKQLQILS